jgi:predicted MFS family arabinose efflux permease
MALSIVMAGGAVGAMVLPPITEALIGSMGWRSACVALSGVVVVGLPTVAVFVREAPSTRGASLKERHGVELAGR